MVRSKHVADYFVLPNIAHCEQLSDLIAFRPSKSDVESAALRLIRNCGNSSVEDLSRSDPFEIVLSDRMPNQASRFEIHFTTAVSSWKRFREMKDLDKTSQEMLCGG